MTSASKGIRRGWERFRERRLNVLAKTAQLLSGELQPRSTQETINNERAVDRLRKLDCANYERCLNIAVACEWPGFKCTECEAYECKPLDRTEAMRFRLADYAIEGRYAEYRRKGGGRE